MNDHLQKFTKERMHSPFATKMHVSTDPTFHDKLSTKKRSDVCFNDFLKRPGREDNFVYNISEGFNLKRRKDEETYFDRLLAVKLAQKEHQYRGLQSHITKAACANIAKANEEIPSRKDDDSDPGSQL